MSDHEFWNEIGNLYFMNGAFVPAIHSYLRAIQIDKKFGRSYSNLARAFVRTGKYDEAIKLYRQSLELLADEREKAATWNRLGILYRQVKDYPNALEAYQQADSLDAQQNDTGGDSLPLTVSMPPIPLDSIFMDEKASAVIVKAPKPKTPAPLLDSDLVPLDPEKIWQVMESEKQKGSAPVRIQSEWNSTYTEDLSGDIFQPGGIPVADDAGGHTQTVEMVQVKMVQYTRKTDTTSAESAQIESDIARYKAETINNPRNVLAWETLADAYKSAGMYKDAIHAFKAAISLNSTRPSFHYRLGLTFAAERREAEAVLAFQKVLELDPHHALAHASLGSHYLKMGMDEPAQYHLKQALTTNFKNQNIYNQACLEAICGNADHALEFLQTALQSGQTHANWARNDPDLDSLHEDPRFKELIAKYSTQDDG